MTHASGRDAEGVRRTGRFLIVAAMAVLLLAQPVPAAAHGGRGLRFHVTTVPAGELERSYVVKLLYPDGDPVVGARLSLSGQWWEFRLGPVALEPAGDPGVYRTPTVTFPIGGQWDLTLDVRSPAPAKLAFQDIVFEAADYLPLHDQHADPEVPASQAGRLYGGAEPAPMAAARPERLAVRDWAGAAVQALHIAAGALWVGGLGLGWLAALSGKAARPAAGAGGAGAGAIGMAPLLHRFGRAAGSAAALLLATGLIKAAAFAPGGRPLLEAGALRALATAPLGRLYLGVLVAKLAAAASMLVPALFLRRWAAAGAPGGAPGRVRWLLAVECGLGLAVIALSALLSHIHRSLD